MKFDCVSKSVIQVHISSQRVKFISVLLRPHRLALKIKFPLELSDISVVRDILDVFLEVSPCCHMTVLSRSWLSGSLNRSFLQESLLDILDQLGELNQQLGELKDKSSMRRYSFLKGFSSLSVLKQDSISSLDMLSYHLWFEIGLSSNQTQSQGLSWWCFYLWYFTVVHLHPFGLTNTFALFIQYMSPSS
jgi:hypothetical protein